MPIDEIGTICGCSSVFWSTVASGAGGLLFGLAIAWPRKRQPTADR